MTPASRLRPDERMSSRHRRGTVARGSSAERTDPDTTTSPAASCCRTRRCASVPASERSSAALPAKLPAPCWAARSTAAYRRLVAGNLLAAFWKQTQ